MLSKSRAEQLYLPSPTIWGIMIEDFGCLGRVRVISRWVSSASLRYTQPQPPPFALFSHHLYLQDSWLLFPLFHWGYHYHIFRLFPIRYGVVANISRSHNQRDQNPRSLGFDSLFRRAVYFWGSRDPLPTEIWGRGFFCGARPRTAERCCAAKPVCYARGQL